MIKKLIEKENLAEIIQIILKVHGKNPELSFMQILGNVFGVNDPTCMTDEQLIEQLNIFYAHEIER